MNMYDVCVLNYVSVKLSTMFGAFAGWRRVQEKSVRTQIAKHRLAEIIWVLFVMCIIRCLTG